MYVINPRKNRAFFFLVEIFAIRVWTYLYIKRCCSLRDAIPDWNAQRSIVLYVA